MATKTGGKKMTNNQEIYENKRNEIIRNNNLLSYFNKGMFVGMATAFLLSSGSYFAINRLTSPAGISETERIEKVQKDISPTPLCGLHPASQQELQGKVE